VQESAGVEVLQLHSVLLQDSGLVTILDAQVTPPSPNVMLKLVKFVDVVGDLIISTE
jgi:hypothetical protein